MNTCLKDTCNNCNINGKINCHFNPGQLLLFYLIVAPTFIIGGIGIYTFSFTALVIWIIIIGLFFLVMEIRILCSHCPHYSESSNILRCWANYGVPKLWKYRPGPMNLTEKITLIIGFIIIWGYPVIFIFLIEKWILLIVYIFSIVLFFTMLRLNNCKRCMNFSCPLNNVDNNIREDFLFNNPLINDSWKNIKS